MILSQFPSNTRLQQYSKLNVNMMVDKFYQHEFVLCKGLLKSIEVLQISTQTLPVVTLPPCKTHLFSKLHFTLQ